MDATFFKRGDGLLVFRTNGRNLYWKEIESEKIEHYESGIRNLSAARFQFQSFIIDGRRGVRQLLQRLHPGIPIQQCQFHQGQYITQKITKRPKLRASKELRMILLTLADTTRATFTKKLDQWHQTWGTFVQERTYGNDRKRKWRYKHEKVRSAYFSLHRNLPWLFTYLDEPTLNIPNTTNSCEGSFTHWKNMVSLHRGLRRDRKKTMIDYLLEKC